MSQGQAPPVEHPLPAAVRVVREEMAALRDANVRSLPDDELIEILDEVSAAEAELAAVKLALVAEADGRSLGTSEATSTAGWLRGRLLLGPGEASRTVKLALALRDESTATGAALARGMLSAEHARVITTAMSSLPPVEADVRSRAEVPDRPGGRARPDAATPRRRGADRDADYPARLRPADPA